MAHHGGLADGERTPGTVRTITRNGVLSNADTERRGGIGCTSDARIGLSSEVPGAAVGQSGSRATPDR